LIKLDLHPIYNSSENIEAVLHRDQEAVGMIKIQIDRYLFFKTDN